MPAPTITPLPPAPLRTQSPATFNTTAEAFVDALEDLPTEINTFGDYLNTYTPPGGYTDEQARAAISVAPTTESTTARTLVLADAYEYIRLTHASGCAVTIPPDSSVAFPIGTTITLRTTASAASSLNPGSGVTLNKVGGGTGAQTFAEIGATAQIKKVATDEWDIIGGMA